MCVILPSLWQEVIHRETLKTVICAVKNKCVCILLFVFKESSLLSHAGTVLLEIMSVIAQSDCGICNRRDAFATGDETLAFSRKMMEMNDLTETVRSCSFIPPEVKAKSHMEENSP